MNYAFTLRLLGANTISTFPIIFYNSKKCNRKEIERAFRNCSPNTNRIRTREVIRRIKVGEVGEVGEIEN